MPTKSNHPNRDGLFFATPARVRTMLRKQRLCRWWVYIVPKGENFYVGITTDPPNRLRQHSSPTSFYLKGPLERDKAILLEKKLKRFTRLEKWDIIREFSQQK
jgi:predicted GIY-YIG superfamily endonuclease